MWKPLVRCWKIFKQYLCHCNIHGLRYLGDDEFSYFERIFWLVACGLCWWGCATMIISVVQDYTDNPVAVTPETTFLEWQTPFPAVIICLPMNNAMKKYFRIKPGSFPNYASAAVAETSAEELLEAYEGLKVPCENLFRNCSWNKESFDCCERFQPLPKTGHGQCVAYNSLQTEKPLIRHYLNLSTHYGDLVLDLFSGPEQLKKGFVNLEIFVMSNDQLPLITNIDPSMSIRLKGGHTAYVLFVLESTANQPAVESVPIPRRNCRFRNELINGSFFDTYTYDSCTLQVIVEQMIKFCGCVHFFYYLPPGYPPCSMKEQQCIIQHKAEILSSEVANERCQVNCDDLNLIVNTLESENPSDLGIFKLRFSTLSFPRLRYRRYVVHDLLDVVVAVGGAVGLFIGASILSIFEIPYWLFIRRDKIE